MSMRMDVGMTKSRYAVVILGAGHNGLVAASYLGRAGLSVLLLEKNDYIGGATTSQKVFPDYEARLSRYSYLVSLFPEKIIRDLGLNLELRRRATGSFTPYAKSGRHDGLLLSNVDKEAGRKSMIDLTGSDSEFEQLKKFYNLSRVFAEHCWDSWLEPLVASEEGEWKVTVGRMGGVARGLDESARRSGADFLTGIRMSALGLNGKSPSVEVEMVGTRQTIEAR